ncbi:DNA polymerase III subunit alpha [Muribaculum intestinale]|uniref:DNA polymerase III subunit alpha n=1 Tax=Muribaculum intestinale TaxID=1796646 RepID=A0A1B1SB79_9BACT|nr:DNA polymerase III subunit alpha [Muribaculum intestinale]ANU64047.1 DNA polymerase III subunit alpha [Muribaculum intestinale]ASB37857.1 DNA polymerase III subunit alpha [Muribaculum intestinale]PWB00533.1 DNA polymerase III subunit alpha [Muribaculum intestinale]PWB07327.1 DNA polymerase III subunit alpha [Muribaculum intestinale]QQR08589.1 DNA polymerase III subunit alpha [Muribaculum intestinale]
MSPFIHLHVHTQYSVLDGQASVTALVDKAISDGMPGIAITDHGNMFGIKEFYNYVKKKNSKVNDQIKEVKKSLEQAREQNNQDATEDLQKELNALNSKIFKPIFGCEMYVAKESLHTHVDKKDTGRHLVVLAKNETGYHNLVKIVSQAWTEGFYSHPRTDKKALAEHHEGLIVCSACLGGEIPRLIQAGDIEEAEKQVKWFKDTFGDDYYIEIQRHKTNLPGANTEVFERQQEVNPELIRIARKFDIKIVATNDVHFVNEDDADAHDRLICVSTNKAVDDPMRMRYTKQEWLKSQSEMNDIFSDIPEAIENTMEILDKVTTYSIDHKPILPNFPLPDGFTDNDDYLRYLTYEGAKRRWGTPTKEQCERLDFELDTIKNMGFPGYFLIVQDFIQAGRDRGVSIGPGRGSAAGSAVAYCLGITQLDPLKYDLLFERFLNPDRISLPDIDIDFDDDGRADVLKYVTDKYGADKVAHIITYGTMAAKMALKDVARVQQLPVAEGNRLTKLIPKHMPEVNGKELKPTLKNCYEYVDEFKAELNSPSAQIRETLKFARQLEGNVRGTGVHACGVIIGRDPITDWVPVSTATDKDGSKLLVTQYEGCVIEETGLIKMDFLGLKTLSIIKEAVNNIRLTNGIEIDIDTIPIDDSKTYQLYCEGRTTGTFQFESPGMQKYLRELQPSVFEDLIAMNALYRPGPMAYIPDFIDRKHGKQPIVYDIPVMEKYLKDTYGVTVYQEQVMLLSRLLANFTRGESDTLRKAMGKKLIDKMNHLKGKFLEGGQANGHKPDVLEKIWADWEKFASYAFNKSHATCYSWVAYQTAYLKANYPAEYMAAVLSRNLTDITKLTNFMDECKSMHINVKGPDVNESFSAFGVNKKGNIRFGLAAIKGIGANVVNAIIGARNKDGQFQSIYDFVERVDKAALNRRTLEGLALSGSFDCFPEVNREDFFLANNKGETLAELLARYGQNYQNAKGSQENSLFGDFDESLNTAGRPPIKSAPRWNDIERLDRERDLVGMYLSGHPLDPYFVELRYGCSQTLKEFNEEGPVEDRELTLAGLVCDYQIKQGRKGPFGILKIEDYSASAEFALFGQDYIDYGKFGIKGTPIIIRGRYGRRFANSDIRFQIASITLLEQQKGKLVSGITLNLDTEQINENLHGVLNDIMKSSTDNRTPLYLRIHDHDLNRSIRLSTALKMPVTRHSLTTLEEMAIDFDIVQS